MNPRFRQTLCVSVAVLSTVAAAGILQTPARAMALNSFGGFGRGMSGIGHGTGGLGAGGAVNGLGGLSDRIGARVVNMSFAGPADPALHRILTAAYEKDEVLIAAAGNAGPNSAPLYPAADPAVIAVTATDNDDGLFKMANRGQYIAVAAPGVDVLALAPGAGYQITTGTSVAAAHVSAIAALLLERKPSLKPGDIRTILMTTAKPLTSMGQNSTSGAGLVNAYRAVKSLNVKSVGADDHDEQAE